MDLEEAVLLERLRLLGREIAVVERQTRDWLKRWRVVVTATLINSVAIVGLGLVLFYGV